MVKFRRLRRTVRPAFRRVVRRLGRRSYRPCLRPARRSGPDDITQALTALNRVIRCHRRLARLAPEFFDATARDRAARARAEQRRWMAIWEPALRKAYGPSPVADAAPDPWADLPRLPGKRTQHAVDRELAALKFWLEAGRLARERHQQRRPHALLSFTQIARLLERALELKKLVLGDALNDPPPSDPDFHEFFAQLRRAYPAPHPPSSAP